MHTVTHKAETKGRKRETQSELGFLPHTGVLDNVGVALESNRVRAFFRKIHLRTISLLPFVRYKKNRLVSSSDNFAANLG